MNDADTLWIVIPAYNEAAMIGEIVTAVGAQYRNVVVVDDCSTDDTGSIARAAGAIVLRHVVNLGAGAATQTGLDFARQRGASCIVTFDADGQHRVEDIAALRQHQRTTGADVVIGSRFLGATVGLPRMRRLLLKLAVLFTWLTTGVRLTDAHNGLRLFTRRAATIINLRQNRMAHASELIEQIASAGLDLVECPVTIVYTDYSLRKGQRLGNAVNILVELFIARLHK